MKYPDGTEIKVGDRVKVAGDDFGVVVLSVDANEYSTEFPAQEWSYLKKGIMIKSEKMGLVHYEEYSEDIELIKR
jgi:hypothetical protein